MKDWHCLTADISRFVIVRKWSLKVLPVLSCDLTGFCLLQHVQLQVLWHPHCVSVDFSIQIKWASPLEPGQIGRPHSAVGEAAW